MLFKSLALSVCLALAGVAAGTLVFFIVHTDATGGPMRATLEITKEWTTETRSDLNSIGSWLTRVETSPQVTAERSGEGDARAVRVQGLRAPDKANAKHRTHSRRWPSKMTLGAPSN